MIHAKNYIEQKAYAFARGVIDVFGPRYGYVCAYSKDGHSWSTEYPVTWYGRKLNVFYSALVNYEVVKEGDKYTVKTWMNDEVNVIGVDSK